MVTCLKAVSRPLYWKVKLAAGPRAEGGMCWGRSVTLYQLRITSMA